MPAVSLAAEVSLDALERRGAANPVAGEQVFAVVHGGALLVAGDETLGRVITVAGGVRDGVARVVHAVTHRDAPLSSRHVPPRAASPTAAPVL